MVLAYPRYVMATGAGRLRSARVSQVSPSARCRRAFLQGSLAGFCCRALLQGFFAGLSCHAHLTRACASSWSLLRTTGLMCRVYEALLACKERERESAHAVPKVVPRTRTHTHTRAHTQTQTRTRHTEKERSGGAQRCAPPCQQVCGSLGCWQPAQQRYRRAPA